ncbi:MAG: type II toxin-antitoxin system Phd/YefM family antitoxin [Bdellovibrionales bacterium]|nr:type II toxin-antitoxin system Phd/YefM family antitoxin [Bdellovibrionales bacterium]
MKKFSAKEAKDEFGRLLDTARQEPVEIQKKGRPVAVVVSLEEYRRLEALENAWWASEAEKALKEGRLGTKDSEKLLGDLLDAKD